jgi:hypothetical protein
MFSAAGRELGLSYAPDILANNIPDAGDVIALVWWHERYGDEGNKYWKTFDTISDDLSLKENTAGNEARVLRIVSPWEIAMLYEALTKETIPIPRSSLSSIHSIHA